MITDSISDPRDIEELIHLAPEPLSLGGHWFRRNNQGYWDWHIRNHREQVCGLIDQVLRADYRYMIDPMPDEQPADAVNRPGSTPWSPLSYWIDKWSVLYSEEPSRRVFSNGEPIAPELATLIEELYDEAHVDEHLHQTDKELRSFGNVVLRAAYDEFSETVVMSRATSPYIRVLQNPINPRKPYATAVVGRVNGGIMGADVYTIDSYAHVMRDKEYEIEPLATRMPPLVHCFERLADNQSGYFCEPPGARLANMVCRIKNDYIDQMGYILLMQGLGVLTISGAERGQKFKIAPNSILQLDNEASAAYYLNPNAPLMDWRESVIMMVQQARESAGIPEALLTADVTASGAAIVAANAPLQEQRRERGKRFRQIEQDLVKVLVDVASTYAPKYAALKALDPTTLSVAIDYVDPAAALNQTADMQQLQLYLQYGVTNAAQIAMQDQPGRFATEEEAWRYVIANQQLAAGQITLEQAMQEQNGDVTMREPSNTAEQELTDGRSQPPSNGG